MRRRAVAAVWMMGATVPLLLATVFVFGCCVLPFHQVAHKLMPICDMATAMMRGEHGHGHDATPAPAPEKQQPIKRILSETPSAFRLATDSVSRPALTPTATTSYRSYITLGAVRCDRDVGWHVVVVTFLI